MLDQFKKEISDLENGDESVAFYDLPDGTTLSAEWYIPYKELMKVYSVNRFGTVNGISIDVEFLEATLEGILKVVDRLTSNNSGANGFTLP